MLKVQEFTEEFKALRLAVSKCLYNKANIGNELIKLQGKRQKVFGDIYLGLVSPSKKKIINSEIRQLEEDINNADIAVTELELRQTLLKRSGGHIREVEEAKNV